LEPLSLLLLLLPRVQSSLKSLSEESPLSSFIVKPVTLSPCVIAVVPLPSFTNIQLLGPEVCLAALAATKISLLKAVATTISRVKNGMPHFASISAIFCMAVSFLENVSCFLADLIKL
jgi:hypothetical protein